jgi:large subunit ribosomal protein L17
MIGDKKAVRVLFEEVAPRFEERDGGYTRILRLAKPRLGDAGTRAILEFVGEHDRVRQVSERPAFEGLSDEEQTTNEAGVSNPVSAASDPDAASGGAAEKAAESV